MRGFGRVEVEKEKRDGIREWKGEHGMFEPS